MKCNFVYGFSTLYINVQIIVIWNNQEFGISMNCKSMCVYNQCMWMCAYYSANLLLQ
jgi:hypothetical protein